MSDIAIPIQQPVYEKCNHNWMPCMYRFDYKRESYEDKKFLIDTVKVTRVICINCGETKTIVMS